MAAKIDIKEVNVTQFERNSIKMFYNWCRKILNRFVMQFMIFPRCCEDDFFF
jgi:hypothetical protein